MDNLPIKIRGLSHPEIPLFDKLTHDEWGWIIGVGTVINQEKAFIASSWSHKAKADPMYFWVSPKAFHHQFYLNVIVPLIDSRPELFKMTCNAAKPDQIVGWACFESPIFYQHYVKEDFRKYDTENLLIMGYRECKPIEFMELINDTRKTEAEKDRVSGNAEHIREGIQTVTSPGAT